ncbi:MAG: DUF2169 domain-containing protein [Proteobacteria bacterium]|nr:DUF2169 domain-containing protein [Pseudomonadota bacterium]
MWRIDNSTPFAAEGSFTQDDQSGKMVWMLAVKASFKINPGSELLSIADQQEEVHSLEEYVGEAHNSSLEKTRDFALSKPKVDILINGTAFAPGGKEVTELKVGFGLGEISKILKITGEREYQKALGFLIKTTPLPFEKMPITYERAFGGWQDEEDESDNPLFDVRNPAGTGFSKKRRYFAGKDLPSVEYPTHKTKRNPKKNRIAGFGPIPGHWQPRVGYAGTLVDKPEVDMTQVRPDDFSNRFYQCAPEDQQIREYTGNEEVWISNMHPKHPTLEFKLPTIKIDLESRMDGKSFKTPAKLQSVTITPDKELVQMVWQGNLECTRLGKTLEYTKVKHRIDQLTLKI